MRSKLWRDLRESNGNHQHPKMLTQERRYPRRLANHILPPPFDQNLLSHHRFFRHFAFETHICNSVAFRRRDRLRRLLRAEMGRQSFLQTRVLRE
jgi:hypothetical protein